MSTTGLALIQQAEAMGFKFQVLADRVRAVPTPPPDVLAELRAHRDEVRRALLDRERRPEPEAQRVGGRAWTRCPVHGAEHSACRFSGRCGWECPCGLCDAWRAAMRRVQ